MINTVKLITKESFGPRLRYLRKRSKLQQEELGDILGVKGATVSRWEKGQMLPTDDKVDLICKYFEKDYSFFAGEEPELPATKNSHILQEIEDFSELEMRSLRAAIRAIKSQRSSLSAIPSKKSKNRRG